MSYIALARRYRPKTFAEVIGQSHITVTLKNALTSGRAAHAYLFAGPRGVGKTTTARILAKALNCEKGPSLGPCGSCASCAEITSGTSLDVLEIDGASNRGIDEIRNLRESVKFAPSKGAFRTYIIDEVHMLTAEAFNALLKTLEEPPPHAKFVFATTQPHKVPPTILSRCQRFDFRKIAAKDIAGNLKDIARAEDIDVSDEALLLIAKYADGSLRDGQVILDQMLSFAKGKITAEDITQVLGTVSEDILFAFSDSIAANDPAAALKMIDRVINDGKDPAQVVLGLITHFRNMSLARISEDLSRLIESGPEKTRRYIEESRRFDIDRILYIIYVLSNTIDLMRRTNLPRIPLEAAMVKLTMIKPPIPLDRLLERVNRLEAKFGEREVLKPETLPEKRDKAGPSPSSDLPSPPAPAGLPPDAPAGQPPEKSEEPPTAGSSEPAAAGGNPELDEVLSSWNSIVNYIRPKRMSVATYLQEGYPLRLENNTVFIGFPEELKFHKETLESAENRRLIEEAIGQALKVNLRVALTLVEPVKFQNHVPRTGLPRAEKDDEAAVPPGAGQKKAEEGPLIKTAIELLGGEIIKGNSGNGRAS